MKLLFRDFKEGIKSALLLGITDNKQGSRMGMLKLYYRAIILPMIISIIVSAVLIGLYGNLSNVLINSVTQYISKGVIGTLGSNLVIELSIIFLYLVFFPLAIMIFSVIFHLIVKILLRLYTGTHVNTFGTSVYGALPFVLFFWVLIIPGLSAIFYVLIIWSIAAFVYASSTRHNISKARALGGLGSFAVVMILIGFATVGFIALF